MVAPAAAAALSSRSSSTTTLQVIYDVHNGDKRPANLVCKILYLFNFTYRVLTIFSVSDEKDRAKFCCTRSGRL